jgi:NADPH2:quinone reductase
MKAIVQRDFGEPDVLRLEDVPDPEPGDGEVRVLVRAAGVHVVDTNLRRGESGPFGVSQLPMTPGREVAGTVDAVGPGVDAGWLGRRVVVHLGQRNGGYAELAIADAHRLHAIPDGVDEPSAVALIGTGRTVMLVLDAAGGVRPDDVALVTAAAGGMGSLLTQAVRAAGATAVGLASGAKVGLVYADVVVANDEPGWAARLGARAPTLLFDGVGGDLGRAAFEALGPGGRIVSYGYASGGGPTPITQDDLWARSLTATVPIGPGLPGLRPLEERSLGSGLRPRVQTFGLADAAAAHAAIEARTSVGKVVLTT